MIPGSGRSPGEGNGNPLQYSCLENPLDGGAWQATVCGVAKSQAWLSDFTLPFPGSSAADGLIIWVCTAWLSSLCSLMLRSLTTGRAGPWVRWDTAVHAVNPGHSLHRLLSPLPAPWAPCFWHLDWFLGLDSSTNDPILLSVWRQTWRRRNTFRSSVSENGRLGSPMDLAGNGPLRHQLGHERRWKALPRRRVSWLLEAKQRVRRQRRLSRRLSLCGPENKMKTFPLPGEATGHDLQSSKEKKADVWSTSHNESPSGFLEQQEAEDSEQPSVWGLRSRERKGRFRIKTKLVNPSVWPEVGVKGKSK